MTEGNNKSAVTRSEVRTMAKPSPLIAHTAMPCPRELVQPNSNVQQAHSRQPAAATWTRLQ